MWYCPQCKEHRQAGKKLDLWRLPDILVFHLKRFSYSKWLKNKLDIFVNFPIHNLDLSKYMKNEGATEDSHVYELYAISNHYGGLGGGHYSAYCKVSGLFFHRFACVIAGGPGVVLYWFAFMDFWHLHLLGRALPRCNMLL